MLSGQRSCPTFVVPGATHVLRHPAHGAQQVGQVGAGHLAAHEVLQVGTPRPGPLCRTGLQVKDLGFECLKEQERGSGRERWRETGRGKETGSRGPLALPRTHRPFGLGGLWLGNGVLSHLSQPSLDRFSGWCQLCPSATPRQPDFPTAAQKVPPSWWPPLSPQAPPRAGGGRSGSSDPLEATLSPRGWQEGSVSFVTQQRGCWVSRALRPCSRRHRLRRAVWP